MNINGLLKGIQSHEQNEWYVHVTEYALYMATGGFLSHANKLLGCLWQYRLPHDRNTWLPDRAFETLWYASAERPAYVPFLAEPVDELERNHRDYLAPAMRIFANDSDYTEGLALAILINRTFPEPAIELKSSALLEKGVENMSGQDYHHGLGLALAAELAARNGQRDKAIELIKKWATICADARGHNFSLLVANRHVAPLLLEKIIAKELKLSASDCEEYVATLCKAIESRMELGQTLVYGDKDWNTLLKMLSELATAQDPQDFTAIQIEQRWLGNPSASDEELRQAEIRIGMDLPEDYKSFLRASNGFAAVSSIRTELYPVNQIDFLIKKYAEETHGHEMLLIVKDYPGKGEQEDFGAIVDNAILISPALAEQELWLIPPGGDRHDWECWFFAPWIPGEHRYKSFRHFIEEDIQTMENEKSNGPSH